MNSIKSMRRIWLLTLFIFLAACQEDAIPATRLPSQTTIQFAVFDWEQNRYEALITAFEAAHPGTAVTLISINQLLGVDSLGPQWPSGAAHALSTAADVISTALPMEAVAQGLALDLLPLLHGENGISDDDFYPLVLAQHRYQGGLYALPLDASYQLMFYDKDAFTAAGLPFPQPGWTWADFLATTQALTRREGNTVTQWGYAEPLPDSNLVQAMAGPLVDWETEPPAVRLTDTAVTDAIQWLADLSLVHQVSPIAVTNSPSAMWSANSIAWNLYNADANIGVVPFPVSDDNEHTSPLVSTTHLTISAATQYPNAAWAWVRYLSQQTEAIGIEALTGWPMVTLPARRSVAAGSDFWQIVDPQLGAALVEAVDHAFVPTRLHQIAVTFQEARQAILTGEQSVATALATAQVSAEEMVEAMSTRAEDLSVVVRTDLPPPETAADITTIIFTVNNVPGQGPRLHALSQEFERLHPHIKVRLREPDFNAGETLSFTRMAANADCFHWQPRLDDPDSLKAILSLEPFFDNDPTISTTDFFPVTLEPFTRQGQVWGLPAEVHIDLIGYDKALFTVAGLPYPDPDWTVDEFLATAVALTHGEGETKQYGYLPRPFEYEDMVNFAESLGAQLIDDSQEPPMPTLTYPATVAALRWYANLTTEFAVKPVLATSTKMGTFNIPYRDAIIYEQQAGMWRYSYWDPGLGWRFPDEVADRQFGYVPSPIGENGRRAGGYQDITGYFISAQSQARDACWQWLVYLTTQPPTNPALPARMVTAQSEAFRQLVGPEIADSFLTTLADAVGPSFIWSDPFSADVTRLFIDYGYHPVVAEGASVEESLAVAQAKAMAYRDCLIAHNGFSDRSARSACLQEVEN